MAITEAAVTVCVASVDGARIRTMPSPAALTAGLARRGDEFERVASEWLPVIHNGRILWAAPDAERMGAGVLTGQGTVLRIMPGTGRRIRAKPGLRLPLADTTRWCPIVYHGAICWISRQFVA